MRHPRQPLVTVRDPEAAEHRGPGFGVTDVTELDADLTRRHTGEPLFPYDPTLQSVTDPAARPPGRRP
ncbi:hypothetical protein [Streptomyces sp. NPDC048516]|uniref:hypothetical protein n=1 Tax=Streptomyces sp. NPDC048516 TaxID=3365565 RepID=UPI003714F5CC